MHRFNESEKKLVRVPAALKRKIQEVIYKSRTVLAECPFGHDVRVKIEVEYVPKGGPDMRLCVEIQRKNTSPGPKLVQSDELFSDEHFELLLRSPLQERDKRFVRFFQNRANKSISPVQWMKEGFGEFVHMRAINSLCRRHRLGVSFAETGEYHTQEGVSIDRLLKYQFYVMEKVRVARE